MVFFKYCSWVQTDGHLDCVIVLAKIHAMLSCLTKHMVNITVLKFFILEKSVMIMPLSPVSLHYVQMLPLKRTAFGGQLPLGYGTLNITQMRDGEEKKKMYN